MEKIKEEAIPLYYQDDKIRMEIDKCLKKNAELESTLGVDSTIKQYSTVKVKQDRLFNKIKKLDILFYKRILPE